MSEDVRERVLAVIAGVLRQAVLDAAASGIVLMHDGSPQAELARACCTRAVGKERVHASVPSDPAESAGGASDERTREEEHRFRARVDAVRHDALVAHPVNKTTLLLGPSPPPDPLLPLGDLYASQVEALVGAWSSPLEVRAIAERVGGIAALDAALLALVDERREPYEALARIPGSAAEEILRVLEAGRFFRRRIGLVPKLSARTVGIDFRG